MNDEIRWVWWPRATVRHAVRGESGSVAVCYQHRWVDDEVEDSTYPKCKRCLRKLGGGA